DGFLRLSSDIKAGCLPLAVKFDQRLYSNIPSTNSNYPFAATAFLWDFRDGYTSTLPKPQHTFQDTGTFMLTLRMTTANGCVFWDSIKIQVGQPPKADFSVLPRQPCLGSPVSFTNLSTGADSFRWEFGDSRTSNLDSPIHEYDTAGTFDILLTA